jgi:hypothetical protein
MAPATSAAIVPCEPSKAGATTPVPLLDDRPSKAEGFAAFAVDALCKAHKQAHAAVACWLIHDIPNALERN